MDTLLHIIAIAGFAACYAGFNVYLFNKGGYHD